MIHEWLLLTPAAAFAFAAFALFVIDAFTPDDSGGGLLAAVATVGGIGALSASGVLLLSGVAAGGV